MISGQVILGAPRVLTADLLRTMNVAVVVCAEPDAATPRLAAARAAAPAVQLHAFPKAHPLRTKEILRRVVANTPAYEARNASRMLTHVDR